MSAVITYENFKGEILISGWETSNGAREELTLLISQYEPQYLSEIMGIEFYELFTAGIANEEERFLKLLTGGKFYENSTTAVKALLFRGLSSDTYWSQPIADYVYYWYCRLNDSQMGESGEMAGTPNNAKRVSASMKAVQAWNRSVVLANQLQIILAYGVDENGVRIYPEFEMESAKTLKPINLYGI
nr:MAG TPA: hypothetical protein [Caudoviricetes sp.]